MTDEMKPIAEVHKDLIAQAEANTQANYAANAAQIAENEKFMQGPAKLNQPVAPEADPAKPAAKPAPANPAQQK